MLFASAPACWGEFILLRDDSAMNWQQLCMEEDW
ncbi:hypothetical protein MOOR_22760 [Moorella thermoacetica]|uniref:Uncharacterized protein n=1 Tax=Neomoorella thermoacetica TaxID=1525 RepID=A0A1J5JH08_NEOTH|nr:hypothetical protein MOOR_22760 [Moorella thermoacetica]